MHLSNWEIDLPFFVLENPWLSEEVEALRLVEWEVATS